MSWLQALRVWARSDRIRTSPLEGKLLRLRPGACVRAGGIDARVVTRDVCASPGHPSTAEVVYTCRAAATDFDLRVRAAAGGPLDVRLARRGGDARPLDPNDVDVFG